MCCVDIAYAVRNISGLNFASIEIRWQDCQDWLVVRLFRFDRGNLNSGM